MQLAFEGAFFCLAERMALFKQPTGLSVYGETKAPRPTKKPESPQPLQQPPRIDTDGATPVLLILRRNIHVVFWRQRTVFLCTKKKRKNKAKHHYMGNINTNRYLVYECLLSDIYIYTCIKPVPYFCRPSDESSGKIVLEDRSLGQCQRNHKACCLCVRIIERSLVSPVVASSRCWLSGVSLPCTCHPEALTVAARTPCSDQPDLVCRPHRKAEQAKRACRLFARRTFLVSRP